jgi:hypothetical protein
MANHAFDIGQGGPIAEVQLLNPWIYRDKAVAACDANGGAGEDTANFDDV